MAKIQPIPSRTSFKDLSNQSFGPLTATNYLGPKNGQQYWRCRCVCGCEHTVSTSNLEKRLRRTTTGCTCSRGGLQTIDPFPTDIDRDAFGHWLSGFTDGEGCFILGLRQMRNGYWNARVKFQIGLRSDDRAALELIQKFWQCGTIRRMCAEKQTGVSWVSNETVCFHIEGVEKLRDIVVPHFERYPLRAKKSRDFSIWKRGVELVARIKVQPRRRGEFGRRHAGGFQPKWTAENWEEFSSLVATLRETRQFLIPQKRHDEQR